jgi:hypothetical protein
MQEPLSMTQPPNPYEHGIDVSSWNNTPALTGLTFLIARACYGIEPDPHYHVHTSSARLFNLHVGAYCFGRHGDVDGQVDALLQYGAGADFYALDLEADGNNPRMTNEEAAAFIRGMHAKGWRCGLYHSEYGFPFMGQDWNWVANWGQPPQIGWTFWQSHDGSLDEDLFNGDWTSFLDAQKLVTESTQEPTITTKDDYVKAIQKNTQYVRNIVNAHAPDVASMIDPYLKLIDLQASKLGETL